MCMCPCLCLRAYVSRLRLSAGKGHFSCLKHTVKTPIIDSALREGHSDPLVTALYKDESNAHEK